MNAATRKRLLEAAQTRYVKHAIVHPRFRQTKMPIYKPTLPWTNRATNHEDFTHEGFYYPVRCSSGFVVRRR